MKLITFLCLLISLTFVSCGDDEDSPTSPVNTNTEALIPLADGNEWVYQSITETSRENDTAEVRIKVEESMTITYQDKEVTAYKLIQYTNGVLSL